MRERTFDDVFAEELARLATAEAQCRKALPRLAKRVSTEELRSTLLQQEESLKQRQAQLKQIAREFGWKGPAPACPAMEATLSDCLEVLGEFAPGNLLDCLLMMRLQQVEHLKVATYAAAVELAKLFEREHVSAFLHEALSAVSLAAKKLSQIAVQVNAEAYVDHRAPGS